MVVHLLACRKDHGRGQSGNWRKERGSGFPRALNEELVHDNKSGHSFYNGNGTWNDTGVVTTTGGKCARSTVILGCILSLGNSRRRLKSDPRNRQS